MAAAMTSQERNPRQRSAPRGATVREMFPHGPTLGGQAAAPASRQASLSPPPPAWAVWGRVLIVPAPLSCLCSPFIIQGIHGKSTALASFLLFSHRMHFFAPCDTMEDDSSRMLCRPLPLGPAKLLLARAKQVRAYTARRGNSPGRSGPPGCRYSPDGCPP